MEKVVHGKWKIIFHVHYTFNELVLSKHGGAYARKRPLVSKSFPFNREMHELVK